MQMRSTDAQTDLHVHKEQHSVTYRQIVTVCMLAFVGVPAGYNDVVSWWRNGEQTPNKRRRKLGSM